MSRAGMIRDARSYRERLGCSGALLIALKFLLMYGWVRLFL